MSDRTHIVALGNWSEEININLGTDAEDYDEVVVVKINEDGVVRVGPIAVKGHGKLARKGESITVVRLNEHWWEI